LQFESRATGQIQASAGIALAAARAGPFGLPVGSRSNFGKI
jgi:hypothetical protein